MCIWINIYGRFVTVDLLFLFVDFLSVMLATGKPDKPKDIKVTVTGNTTKVSWQIPLQTGFSRIYLKNSATTYVSLDLPRSVSTERRRMNRDLHAPASSIVIEGLQMCSEYVVIIMIYGDGAFSEETEQKFWITNELEPPKNVTIQVIGNIAKISWTITTTHEVNTSLVSLFDSNGTKVSIDSSNNYKYLKFRVRSYEIINLTLCSEYAVKIEYQSRGVWSGVTEQKFWMTNNTFTADINDDAVLSWTTNKTNEFKVMAPFNSKVIYSVQFGNANIPNSGEEKYIFDKTTQDVRAINITVIRVNKADAGIYRAEGDNKHVDGCCLLIVTSKPINTKLTLKPEHPFVGDNVTFTCSSTIQRWPAGYRSSHLSYQFHGNKPGATDNNRLMIHTLTKSDKGTNIKCQATDDLGKVSNMSNTVTLDPYYGPDNVVMEPAIAIINLTEGTALGPIHCNATCNPGCKYTWKENWAGRFKPVPNEFILNNNRSVHVLAIKRNQNGTYRCRVDHSTGDVKKTKDILVNVQYSPKITDIWFSSNDQRYEVRTPTTFDFNEEVNVKMTLRMESNPGPQIMFKSSLLKIQRINKGNGFIDYISNLPSLRCEDSGNFSIRASNGIPFADTRTVNLKICCKPRNATAKSRQIGTKVDTTENIVMHVVSFPLPTVEWCRVTRSDWTVTKERYDYRYKIESEIHIESEKDLGVYGLKICNKLGCIEENITLTPEDKPEAPTNVSVETITFRSVNLSWIVGFNGGHKQTFSVLFKATDNDNWETREEVHTGESTTGSKVYYTLDHLAANKQYHVIVRSTNKHGNRSASLDFKTKVEPTLASPSKSGSDSIPIACGVVGVLLIIVITLLVFFIKRKKRSKTEPKESNVLYAAVDKEQQKSKRRNTEKEDSKEPANAEYASVVKPKSKSKKVHYKEDVTESANDEYAVVDKSNKKIDYTENDNVYANQGDADLLIHQPLKTKPSGRSKNKDGLTYIEVSFTKKPKRRRIIGAENRTDYVDIDFTRKADPLPDSSDQ
ncbi:uncharacterized protein LOC127702263 isoform X2 [Mytilus californianus]|uniref:uncharacterized protein LOC127702263 isoform X2 n=1 Tax=Mytilus californianus TaxID=6549 RepID=UPI0022455278|nr:uncharacterized protein LOC127702263 isoform X2 [Mytilus californianus]